MKKKEKAVSEREGESEGELIFFVFFSGVIFCARPSVIP